MFLLSILIQYSCITCDKLLPLKRRFRDSQIVIITTIVVVSSVGIKRVVCTSNCMCLREIHNVQGYYSGYVFKMGHLLVFGHV